MITASSQQNNIDLGDLYQEVLLEHAKRPRFKSKPNECRFCEEGKNPLCGDVITVYCHVDEKNDGAPVSLKTSFQGSGCSISQASASMMCELLQNVTFAQAKDFIQHAEQIYTGKIALLDDIEEDVQALYGVSKFPVRIKCAALAWKTMEWLLNHHFDKDGFPKLGCKNLADSEKNCTTKKLKVVSTDEV